jgi:hypothetical protein
MRQTEEIKEFEEVEGGSRLQVVERVLQCVAPIVNPREAEAVLGIAVARLNLMATCGEIEDALKRERVRTGHPRSP